MQQIPNEFWKRDFDDSSWREVELPHSWQCEWSLNNTEGIDPPIYTNMDYPFEPKTPYSPEYNPTAAYRLIFDWVNDTSKRKCNFISGAGTHAYV